MSASGCRAQENLLTRSLSIRYTNRRTPAAQSGWRTPRASRHSFSKETKSYATSSLLDQWKTSKYRKISLDIASDK